jgi:REP element-mobilizing transposase RayT
LRDSGFRRWDSCDCKCRLSGRANIQKNSNQTITTTTTTNHQTPMPHLRINSQLNSGQIYFLTPTIKNWYYIFDRHERWQIIANSIKFFQQNKGLEVFAYVFMLNHLHLIVKSPDIIGFMRDFKKFTSKKLIENIAASEPDVLCLFQSDKGYEFWKSDNFPKLIEAEKFLLQKVNYIHENPVKKSYVERPEFWKWSSANPNSEIEIASW